MSGGMSADEALRRLVDAAATLDVSLGADGWRIPGDSLLAALGTLNRIRGAVEAAHLDVLRQIDSRGIAGSIGSSPVASTTEGLVRETTGAAPAVARRDVAAARATASAAPLAAFRERLRTGAVRREHVDVAVACLDRLPGHLLRRPGAAGIVAAFLLEVADSRADARTLDRYGRQLLARLDPDGTSRADPQATERAFLDLHTDGTGMVVGRFQLDPVAGAALRTALDACSAPAPVGTDQGQPVRDDRPARRRRADALATLAETALGVAVPRRGERPRIVVTVTADQLAGTGAGLAVTDTGEPLPAWVTQRLACDAVVQRMVVDPALGPLDVGRGERCVTLAQRRALAVRDRGCLVCEAPPDWCDAHHVIAWSQGGATDLANLVLLCPAHHTAVHAGSWQVTRTAHGQVELVPPRWVDPARRPRQPVAHRIAAAVSGIDAFLRDLLAEHSTYRV